MTKIGSLCPGLQHEQHCGRILGLDFDKNGYLIVADAYFGLFKIDLKTNNRIPLVPSTLLIDGKRNLITNSLAISKDSKTIYYTVSRHVAHVQLILMYLKSAVCLHFWKISLLIVHFFEKTS